MSVKHIHEVESSIIADGVGVTRKVLISPAEAPNFAMRCFTIQPGGSMPRHTNLVEHEQFVLGGRAKISMGDDEFEVQKGDIVFIPADLPHGYINIGEEPFEFLCLVPAKEDIITLLG